MRVGIAQVAPVLLDRDRTIAKVVASIAEAGAAGCELVVFGEALVPGYPVWIERTHGAAFDDDTQKSLHALYLDQAVTIERGHLAPICEAARRHGVAVIVGIIERPLDRAGYTAYASRVFVDGGGDVGSVHRKLVPTFEERLAWGAGDGAGLRVHPVGEFTVGALNCWENWMPLARAALYAQGEDLHVMLWPGGIHNTERLTPVVAQESRSYVISVSGLLRTTDVADAVPKAASWWDADEDVILDGGSCVCAPDGSFLIEPVVGRETLLVAELDPAAVRAARHNFDPSGHYCRPDVFSLSVDRRRQRVANFVDEPDPDAA